MTPPEWSRGGAFEHAVLRVFELEGTAVKWPYEVRLGGIYEQIDGTVYAAGLACLVESKDTADRIDFAPIAKLWTQLSRRPGTVIGLMFSRSGFTTPAFAQAQSIMPPPVLLWEGVEMEAAAGKGMMIEALELKYRAAVEAGDAAYNVLGVLGALP